VERAPDEVNANIFAARAPLRYSRRTVLSPLATLLLALAADSRRDAAVDPLSGAGIAHNLGFAP
jgi:hypothetical protein